ncbi:MAG: response regulator, partial [Planctomycetes bacterium]|nr:response regulator [Planctomycetota bacterium]
MRTAVTAGDTMPTPLHLLVVDDQPHITGYFKQVLESMGHRVDTAGNGIEAMNAIDSRRRAQDPHDLVIADITMPLLDGLSMIKELRRAKDPIDVALMTGNAEMIARLSEDVQRLGCIAVLAKPIDTVHLGQVLDFATMRQSRAAAFRTASHARHAQPPTPENSTSQHRRATGGPPDTGEYKPTAVPSSRQPPHAATPPVPPRQTDQRFVSGFHTPVPQAPQVPAAPPRLANDPRYVSRVMPPQPLPPVPGSGFSQQQQPRYQPPQTPQQQVPQRGVPPVARPVGDPRQPQAPLRPEGRQSPPPAAPTLGGV